MALWIVENHTNSYFYASMQRHQMYTNVEECRHYSILTKSMIIVYWNWYQAFTILNPHLRILCYWLRSIPESSNVLFRPSVHFIVDDMINELPSQTVWFRVLLPQKIFWTELPHEWKKFQFSCSDQHWHCMQSVPWTKLTEIYRVLQNM